LALGYAHMGEIFEELNERAAAHQSRKQALTQFKTIKGDSISAKRQRRHLTRHINEAGMRLLEPVVTELRKMVDELDSPDRKTNLADALHDLGNALEGLGMSKSARPILEEEVTLRRMLSDELRTPDANYALADALAPLGSLVLALDGPDDAEIIFKEEISLCYLLVEEEASASARRRLIDALFRYDAMHRIIFTEYSKVIREEIVTQCRMVAQQDQTPEAYVRLAEALRYHERIVERVDGLAAARTMREEAVALSRTMVHSKESHRTLDVLAGDLTGLARFVEDLDGALQAIPLMEEATGIRRTITERPPFAAHDRLALSLYYLGTLVLKAHGPSSARPYREEEISVLRNWVAQDNSDRAIQALAFGLEELALVLDELEGSAAAAENIRREAETICPLVPAEIDELDEWETLYDNIGS
jgi:tetratricopeptide (TPR) repeat protein